jgi:hypothetical protein
MNLAVQLCSSSQHTDKGQGDYAGMNGPRGLPGMAEGYLFGQSYSAGIMIAVGQPTTNVPVRGAHIRDGLSNTLLIVESAGRTDGNRFWADAHQTFAQHGPINVTSGNEMFSDHPGGVFVAFADTHVVFFPESVDMTVIDALSTRARGEAIDATKF